VASAATYYASPDGSGTGTEDSPYSLADGIDKVKNCAHTLVLKRGRYLLNGAIAFNGTSSGNNPTIVCGETGDPKDVVLDAQGKSEVMRVGMNVLVAGITIKNGNNKNSSLATRAAGVRVGYNTNLNTLSVVSNCVVTCCTNAFTETTTNSIGTVIYGGAVCVYDTGLLVDSYVTNNTAAYRSGGVVFRNGVVRRCTISDNYGFLGGGGVFCERNCSGVLADSTISGNICNTETNSAGGGVSCYLAESSLVITNCTIAENKSAYGGGLDLISTSTATCLDCRFVRNEAIKRGGGMRVYSEARGVFRDCVFEENSTTGTDDCGGGGCCVYNQSADGFASFSNCVFRNNHSNTHGGGFSGGWNRSVCAELVGCVITNNSSVRQGAGVMIRDNQTASGCSLALRNCLVAFNYAKLEGGGVYLVATNAVVDSCTIVSNRVSDSNGAGLYHRWGGAVTNTVIAFNVQGSSMETELKWCLNEGKSPDAYRNCCVWPEVPSVFLSENGCVNADPRFVDAANGDFRLSMGSPCKDAGILEGWMAGAFDLAGGKRVFNGVPDIGCYEFFLPPGFMLIFR